MGPFPRSEPMAIALANQPLLTGFISVSATDEELRHDQPIKRALSFYSFVYFIQITDNSPHSHTHNKKILWSNYPCTISFWIASKGIWHRICGMEPSSKRETILPNQLWPKRGDLNTKEAEFNTRNDDLNEENGGKASSPKKPFEKKHLYRMGIPIKPSEKTASHAFSKKSSLDKYHKSYNID